MLDGHDGDFPSSPHPHNVPNGVEVLQGVSIGNNAEVVVGCNVVVEGFYRIQTTSVPENIAEIWTLENLLNPDAVIGVITVNVTNTPVKPSHYRSFTHRSGP